MNSKDTLVTKWYCGCVEHIKQLITQGFYFSKRKDLQNAVSANGSCSADTLNELAVKYYNISSRIPQQQKYTVQECKGINCPLDLQTGYEMLKQELKDGCCLIPRMSRAAKDFDACDGMLNDWGIQHFHLGTSPDRKHPDLVQGGRFVAYVYMTGTEAYIITIGEHGKWGEKALLEKLLSDFPNVLDDWKTDAKDLSYEVDGKDRETLRNAHVNTPVVLNEKVYMRPFGGEASDGSSMRAVWRVLQDRKFLLAVCDCVINALEKCGWNDSDIGDSKLLAFCRGPNRFVRMAKKDGSSQVLVCLENGKLVAKESLPVS